MGDRAPRRPESRLTTVLVAVGLAIACMMAAEALPWPPLASRSLGGIFLLVAITFVSESMGLRSQAAARHAVGGLALTAAVWFAGAGVLGARPALAVLAALHVGAAALALADGTGPRATRALVATATALGVSLAALGALPRDAGVPGSPMVPGFLAGLAFVAAWLAGRGRMAGLMLAALVGVFAAMLALVTAPGWVGAAELGPGGPLQLAWLPAGTAVGAAGVAIVMMARRLRQVYAVIAPDASEGARELLSLITLPAAAAIAVVVFSF